MNLSKCRCVKCGQNSWLTYSTYWECQGCKHRYSCTNGMPRLYLESDLGSEDKALRDYFYNGLLGTYYQFIMPFLVLPARPLRISWKGWLVYFLIVAILIAAIGVTVKAVIFGMAGATTKWLVAASVATLLGSGYFFYRHPYLLYLLLIAVPVKISLLFNRFRSAKSFPEIHNEVIERLQQRSDRLQVLDISTGTCNSLYRHGWMKLNADYAGLDLSETMLSQGQEFMARAQAPVDFVLGDAQRLPFVDGAFDVVLNYGALNGYADAATALSEMARVAKPGGVILFLDEQLYDSASRIEEFYFRRVLSSHNVIHHCPVELMPSNLKDVNVHQVYQFYYICTAVKT